MSHTPRRLRPRRQPKGIPFIFRSRTRPVITEQEARVIRARYEDARPIRWSDAAETALGVVLGLAIGAAALAALGGWVVRRVWP